MSTLCEALDPIAATVTPEGADPDAVLDVRAVLPGRHPAFNITDMPARLFPTKGRLGLHDYEKVFCPSPVEKDIFDLRGIDRQKGCLVLVRPDQYVAGVFPSDNLGPLNTFLQGVFQSG